MNLYLLRHGITEEHASSGRDEDRELTDEGRDRLTDLLHRVARYEMTPDVIVSSPYKRAVQTAKLATKILRGPDAILSEAIVPHARPVDLWDAVRSHNDAGDLLIASHEPLLSSSVSYLLDSPTLQVEMKKGAMVALRFENLRKEPRGILRWMLTPKLCA